MNVRVLLALALAGCVPKQGGTAFPAAAPAPAPAGGEVWTAETPPAAAAAPAPAAPTPTSAPAPEPTSTSALPTLAQRQLDDTAALLSARDEGRAKAALVTLESLAKEHPEAPEVYYNMGLAHDLLGDTVAARRAWTRATEIDPAFASAWLNLGVLSARAGKLDIALATFQTGTRYNERDMGLRAAAVSAQRLLGRFDDAVTTARAALAINSRALPIYTNLALVYLATDRVDLARFTLEKALVDIKDAGSDPLLHAVLGQVYGKLDYSADALVEYRKALELDPYQLDALQALGRWYLDNRAWVDAAPIWERVITLVPTQVGGRLNLGIAYRGLGRFDDAKRVYEECLRIDPRNPEPYRNLAVLYGDYLKDYDTALATLDKYRSAGGGPAADIDKWVEALKKEKARKLKAEERKRQDEDRKRQDEVRRQAEDQKRQAEEQQRQAEEQQRQAEEQKREAEQPKAPEPTPAPPVPSAPEPSTPPTDDPSPWGGGG